jgi:hypothetical protein
MYVCSMCVCVCWHVCMHIAVLLLGFSCVSENVGVNKKDVNQKRYSHQI